MHHIYTTPAFVVHGSPYGEAGKFLLLFTRDFGMIGATAQGIRLAQSKLRYHVQDASFVLVSIVRGKEVWRLTGAHEIEHGSDRLLKLKILKFLKRLLQGEESNPRLFEIIESLYKTLIEEKYIDTVEYITILRILNTLGYIRNTDEISIFLENDFLDMTILEKAMTKKRFIIQTINTAINESQL